jgi:hypothetical protein
MVDAPNLIDNNDGEKYSLQVKLLSKKFLKFNYAVYCSVVTNCCTAASVLYIAKRRKTSRPGFKAGPHAHVDTTNTCVYQITSSASDARKDNKFYLVDIAAVLADSALSSR